MVSLENMNLPLMADRSPTLLVTKNFRTIPGLSMTPEAFFQDPVVG